MKYIKSYKVYNHKDLEKIDESWREVVLGLLMLGGATFGHGQEKLKTDAQRALTNQNILDKMETVIDDDKKMDKLLTKIPDEYKDVIIDNKDEISKKIDKKNIKTRFKVVENTNDIKDLLDKGWGLTNIRLSQDTIMNPDDTLINEIDLEIEFKSDAAFKTGTFEVTKEYEEVLKSKLDEFSEIHNIKIESSTDKEPIKMGNEKLAELRAKSIKDLLPDGIDIEVDLKPDQGPEYESGISNEERIELRKQTAEYRYVKITISGIIKKDVKSTDTPVEINKKMEVELVRVYQWKKGWDIKPPKILTKKNKNKKAETNYGICYFK